MSDEANALQVWRVECEDGVREALVAGGPVWWSARSTTPEVLASSPGRLAPRVAVADLAAKEGWPVVSILAPGQPTADEALSALEVRVSGGGATPEERVAYLRERLTREESWSHRMTHALALRIAREHGRASPVGDDIIAAVDEASGIDAPTSNVDTITEREAAAFKRGAEMVRGIFAQGGMRVAGSTDDLIRAFGEVAR